jgi:hypothetical protein
VHSARAGINLAAASLGPGSYATPGTLDADYALAANEPAAPLCAVPLEGGGTVVVPGGPVAEPKFESAQYAVPRHLGDGATSTSAPTYNLFLSAADADGRYEMPVSQSVAGGRTHTPDHSSA